MTDKQIRPPYEIALMHDHILRLEEELKAKEQECETLASQLDFEVQKKECLEQECEELKRQLETKGKILILIDEAKNEYSKENNKLKQAIEKIKDFVENEMIPNGDTHIILQICDEVTDV